MISIKSMHQLFPIVYLQWLWLADDVNFAIIAQEDTK